MSDKQTRSEIEAAYAYCQQTARAHAKSFYFSARFLPRHKRRAIYAVYALCRHVDDAVDCLINPTEAEGRAAVKRWQSQLDAAYKDAEKTFAQNSETATETLAVDTLDLDTLALETPAQSNDLRRKQNDFSPILIAWREMLKSYRIPQDLPLELMRGVLMDTNTNRYGSWEELKVYCYRVASTVGLMVTEIFGYRGGTATLHYAETLGYAMQLTNILRDIGEDARMNRIYLPQNEMREFNVTDEDIMRGLNNERFKRLMRFEIRRARTLYAEAERGISMLNGDARFTVLLAARLYARILDEIEAADFDVFSHRAHTTLIKKMRSVPRIWREARRL